MTRNEKGQQINDLIKKFKDNNHFYIADTSGLVLQKSTSSEECVLAKGLSIKFSKIRL